MYNNWTEKYWKLILNENFEDAIPLKNSNFPHSFFKYRSLSERTLESLREGYIWLADISSLNDPFECTIQFDNNECWREYYSTEKFKDTFKKTTGQILSQKELRVLTVSAEPFKEYIRICGNRNIPFALTAEQQKQKIQNRWIEIQEETNRNLRICSFSLNKNSLLLWSHYADEHKGICIEYNFEDIDVIRAFMQPIIYRDKVHKMGLMEEYSTMQMIGSSLIKSKDWEYEQEWRLTIFKQQDNFPKKMPVPLPKAIYLGTRFKLVKKDLKDKLFLFTEEYKIPLFQMRKDSKEFKLISYNYKNDI
ncbi:DUF2971 domain-containing protein [Dysgonomonas sp. HDW5B]|uniref:DUF2971 domain-containing protein n=1 Tax=Dysgonomonas sp. HDW5B TaxID=2714927 RepID=UPI001408F648|nr:DUF2971 domain-containing protein [Dysgonomonas sp. HDW5B]QIK54460.1 DUF2971 domain-containing protein [Dysgonomonas sp. HDW5B]